MKAQTLNKLRITAVVWLIMIGLNALAAGFSFMVEPSGKDIGIPLSYLQYSPFDDYFIPGVVLFTTIGVLSTIAAYLGFKKHAFFPWLLLLQGCMLLGWIVIQMLLVRDVNALHVICGVSALAWLVMGFILRKKGQIQSHNKKQVKGF